MQQADKDTGNREFCETKYEQKKTAVATQLNHF